VKRQTFRLLFAGSSYGEPDEPVTLTVELAIQVMPSSYLLAEILGMEMSD